MDTRRPSFNDQNPTDSDPLHTPPAPAATSPAVETDASLPPTPSLTEAEAAIASKALFEPTLRRMTILVQTLIQVSENGDFALWATLGCLDQTLRGLDWSTVSPERTIRFYALIRSALVAYATKVDEHISALTADPAAAPILPEWTTDDTLRMYDAVDAEYPPTLPTLPTDPNEVQS